MNKQRHIFLRKITLRTFPDFLFGSVKLLSKNLKSEKKSENIVTLGFHFTGGSCVFNLHGSKISNLFLGINFYYILLSWLFSHSKRM